MSQQLNIDTISKGVRSSLKAIGRYRVLLFFLLLTSIYAYIVWRINVLSSAPPSQADISGAQQSTSQPKISPATVKKLEGLEDNSVRVQTLFNEARQNPFLE